MNILHVIATVHREGGGTSEVVPRLCEALSERGEDVVLATLKTDDVSISAERAFAAGVRYDGSSRRFGIGALKQLGYSREFASKLKRLVEWADIVHVHGLWMWPMWAACAEARRQSKPYVMMPHGFLDSERLKISKWKKKLVGTLYDRPALERAGGIIATSEQELVGIRRYGIVGPIRVIPIGLDYVNFRHSMCEGRTLLYFSRITPIKGLDMLASAWGSMDRKGWRLLIVGPDDRGYTQRAKELFAASCPLDSFEFRGPVFGVDKYELFASSDAFVLPTRSENWSVAVAEAMASGLPVVCTKGAPWSCLDSAQAGWWVDVSVAGIRDGLEKLIALSANERREMGLRGAEWVKENLSWGKIAHDTISYYDSILQRNPKKIKKNKGDRPQCIGLSA